MKKIILIISAVLLAAGIIGCAILAVPVVVNGEQYMNDKMESKMETTTFVFDKNNENGQQNNFSQINLDIQRANVVFRFNKEDKTTVNYSTPDKNKKLTCFVDNGKLHIYESREPLLFSMLMFGDVLTRIEISLPERYRDTDKLSSLRIYSGAGSVSGDIPYTETAEILLSSGKVNVTALTGDMKIDIGSGKAEVSGRDGEKNVTAETLNVECRSGSVVLNNFNAKNAEFKLGSGNVTATGNMGKIKAKIYSGRLEMHCTGNVEKAELDQSSGTTYITLPKISSAKVEYSVSSGSVDVELGGNAETLTKSGTRYYGTDTNGACDTYITALVSSGKCVIEEINR